MWEFFRRTPYKIQYWFVEEMQPGTKLETQMVIYHRMYYVFLSREDESQMGLIDLCNTRHNAILIKRAADRSHAYEKTI